jgi:hypothetical protein
VSAVQSTQSGVRGVYATQSGSSTASTTAKKSAHNAVSQTQPGSSITLFPQPGFSGVTPKNKDFTELTHNLESYHRK